MDRFRLEMLRKQQRALCTRSELIDEVAEFLADDERSGDYYMRDTMAAYRIGETEYKIAYDMARELKWERERPFLFPNEEVRI